MDKEKRKLYKIRNVKNSNQKYLMRLFHIHHGRKKMVSETDCFVTGSDQIWNTYNCFSAKSFLSFAGEKTSCLRIEYWN